MKQFYQFFSEGIFVLLQYFYLVRMFGPVALRLNKFDQNPGW